MVEKLGTGQEALGAMVEESKKEKQQDMMSLFEQVRYIKDTIEKEDRLLFNIRAPESPHFGQEVNDSAE